MTPLAKSEFNHTETVFNFLLEKGANLVSLDVYGRTPLQRACVISLDKTIEILLQVKANISFKNDKSEMTALHYATATSNTRTDICRMLLTRGAELNGTDKWGPHPDL